MSGYAVRAEGLVKHYGKLEALAGIDLEVPEGTVFGLLGTERGRQDHGRPDPRDDPEAGRRARRGARP